MIQEIIVYIIGLFVAILLIYKLIKGIFGKKDAGSICSNCCSKANYRNYHHTQISIKKNRN